VADTTVGFHFDYVPAAVGTDDRDLAEALRAGEETAYETLIQRFEQPVLELSAAWRMIRLTPPMWSRKFS